MWWLLLWVKTHFQTGEGRSQTDISLKGLQQELLEEIYSVNKNVVVVLMNGRALEINWMAENVPAILETWHLGSEAGNAIADVLFGDFNPAGKLPISFPRSVGQEPLYYNHLSTGRPSGNDQSVFWSHYTDEKNTPLYPFRLRTKLYNLRLFRFKIICQRINGK